MQRIAAPMVGGMVTAPLLSLFVIPTIYLLWKRRAFLHPKQEKSNEIKSEHVGKSSVG
jgi:Cu(I)/Ag(I) efflux system membrane protein CusA/SilA